MKKTLLIILGILLSIKVSAQSAHDLLNSIVEKNKSYNDISIIFEYEFKNETNGFSENTGGYMYMKGNSFVINMDGQEMICDGKTLWTHLIDDEEVMISDATEDGNISPLAIIETFSQNVNVSFDANNNDSTTLLIEEEEKSTFEIASISVDKDLKIIKLVITTLDGDVITYKINSFKTNQDLPNSMFIFDERIYPNVEIIDMR